MVDRQITIKVDYKADRPVKDGDVFKDKPMRNQFGNLFWCKPVCDDSFPEIVVCFDDISTPVALKYPDAKQG